MAHGLWLMAYGLWLMAHGSAAAYGLWLMACGLWPCPCKFKGMKVFCGGIFIKFDVSEEN